MHELPGKMSALCYGHINFMFIMQDLDVPVL